MVEKIIVGARELFMQFGIRSVSMDDIARHLSMSKKTIYQHFKDKDEIVNEGTRSHLELQRAQFGDIIGKASNAIEELHLLSKCVRQEFSQLNPSLLFDLKKFHPEAYEQYEQFRNKDIYNDIIDNLNRGIMEGYFRPEIDKEVLAKLRLEEIQLSFDGSVFPRDQFDFVNVQIQMFQHFVYGIVTQEGKELYENYQREN